MCSSNFTSLSGVLWGGIALTLSERGAVELLKSQSERFRPFGGEQCSEDWLLSDESIVRNRLPGMWDWERKPC